MAVARMTADERRAELVDAAVVVLSRDGVAGTTTRSIVAEAGMQIGVFHYCFRSKEELMRAVMKKVSEHSFEAVREVLAAGGSATELIRGVIDAHWAHLSARPEEHLLVYELTHYALRHPGEQAAAQAQYEHYFRAFEGFLHTVEEVGGVTWRSRPDKLSRLIVATLQGLTFQWLVERDDETARQMLDDLIARLHREAGLTETG